MFNTSTIKSIFKILTVTAIFSAIAIIAMPNVVAFAQGSKDLTPALCGAGSPNGYKCSLFENAGTANTTLGNREGILKFILNIASFFIYIASAVAVLFIVWGGYQYINAADPKGNENGKKILINALIGLAICILSITIVTFVGSTLDSNLISSIAK